MTQTTIYLLRHAQTIPVKGLKNRDWTLTERGREQAEKLARYLVTLPIDEVYCSPFIRARQTLTPYLKLTGKEVHALQGLAEHEFAPDWMPPDEYAQEMKRFWDDGFQQPEIGGESGAVVQVRVLDAIGEAVQAHSGKTILMCSHAQPIAWALRTINPTFNFEDWTNMRMPEIFRLIYNGNGCTRDLAYSSPDF